MDPIIRARSSDQIVGQIMDSVTVIKGTSQLVDRRLVSGSVITPDFLTSSMSKIQRASDSIAANMLLLSGLGGPG